MKDFLSEFGTLLFASAVFGWAAYTRHDVVAVVVGIATLLCLAGHFADLDFDDYDDPPGVPA